MPLTPRKALVGIINANGIPVHNTFDSATDVFVGPDGEPISSNAQNLTNIENTFVDATARTSNEYASEDIGKVYVQSDDNTLWLLVNNDPQEWTALGSTEQVYNYVYTDTTERVNGTYTSADVGKIARQADDNTMWVLTKVDNGTGTWVKIITNELVGQPNGIASLDGDGTLDSVQVPDLDAAKIATGEFDAARIPVLDAAKVTTGEFDAARIPVLDAAKVTTGEFDAARIPVLDAAKVTTGEFDTARIPVLDATKVTTGEFDAARIPVLDATKVTTGEFDAARIPVLDATKVTTGEFDAARIPVLDAAKVTTGEFATARIPVLSADKITTGTFADARIPALDATKITSGTIDMARIPAAAVERLSIVADETARFNLTVAEVQIGDTVKQTDTGIMYVVVDTAQLDNNAGYNEYVVGTAAAVPWSGVTDKPSLATTAQLSDHTDNTTNPHTVTAAQVGAEPADAAIQTHLGATDNPHTVTAAQVGAEPADAAIQTHLGATDNPHTVTAAQVGAATTTALTNHTNSTSNPHSVTATQIGAEVADAGIQAHIASLLNPHGVSAAQIGAEPADAAIQNHITSTTVNPHAITSAMIGAAPISHAVDNDTYGYGTATNAGHVRPGVGLTATNGTMNILYGSAAGTAAQGNDPRLENAGSVYLVGNTIGTPPASSTIHTFVASQNMKFEVSLPNSAFACEINPSAATTFIIQHKNETAYQTIGSFTINTDGSSTVSFLNKVIVGIGHKIKIVSPAALNGIADVSWTIGGQVTTELATDRVVDIDVIPSVVVPVTGGTPVTSTIDTEQYTGVITDWSPAVTGLFDEKTAYTVTIELTAKEGYTFTGVPANFFLVGGLTATNAADSGYVTKLFPATEPYLTFNATTQTVTAYNTLGGTDLTIPATIDSVPVLHIGDNALTNKGLTSLSLPEGLQTLGYNSLSNNPLISSYTMPSTLTTIGGNAFAYSSMTSLGANNIGTGVTSIGDYAFTKCPLTSVVIPDSVEEIGASAFLYDSFFLGPAGSISSLTLGSGVTTIGNEAFKKNAITSINLPASLTTLGSRVFANNALSSITIPSTWTTIPMGCFENNALTSISIPASITTVGHSAFNGNLLTSLVVPNTVTTLEPRAFSNNPSLTTVTIGTGVTVCDDLFYQCPITQITIPSNVNVVYYSDPYATFGIYGGSFRQLYMYSGGQQGGTYNYNGTGWVKTA